MKTATLPAIRVDPELREKIEAVLGQGETLSSFMEATLRSAAEFRSVQNDFHARGRASSERFKATGVAYTTAEVLAKMQAKIERRRKQLLAT